MPALEYVKVPVATQFPMVCICCGASKGPFVDTFVDKRGVGGHIEGGRIYLCRMCVKRSARAFGMVQGDEMEKLQNAADELAQAQREIDSRQEMIDDYTAKMGDDAKKMQTQREFIEGLQGEIALYRAKGSQINALTQEMITA